MRGGQNVVMRILAVALVCVLPAGVAAQQQAQPQSQPQTSGNDAQLERIKNEVRNFEIVLFRSIETAGQKLAAWAETKVPNVLLSPAADPVVNGFPTADSSLVFMVRIPELSGVAVFTNGYRFFPTPEKVTGPTRPVSTAGQAPPGEVKPLPDARADGKVTSTTVVADDPMKNGPPNPNTMYSDLVRLGLMDAMLDSSSVLTVKNDQWLTVVAIPIDVLVTNPYYRNTSRKLILSIKGEDLAALRAGTITRDEAKQRIVDTRF
jgi:hypothetical protein